MRLPLPHTQIQIDHTHTDRDRSQIRWRALLPLYTVCAGIFTASESAVRACVKRAQGGGWRGKTSIWSPGWLAGGARPSRPTAQTDTTHSLVARMGKTFARRPTHKSENTLTSWLGGAGVAPAVLLLFRAIFSLFCVRLYLVPLVSESLLVSSIEVS